MYYTYPPFGGRLSPPGVSGFALPFRIPIVDMFNIDEYPSPHLGQFGAPAVIHTVRGRFGNSSLTNILSKSISFHLSHVKIRYIR